MASSSSFRWYLMTIIASALIVIGLLGALWWLWGRIEASRAALEESQNRVALLEDQRFQARILMELLKKRAHDLERVRTLFIVDHERPIAFIEAMEALAERTGASIKLTIDSNNRDAKILGLHAVITGSEANVQTMLRAVELVPYQISIDELAFQGNHGAVGGAGHAARALNGNRGSDDSTILTLTLRVHTL